jgi:hypothetical protein
MFILTFLSLTAIAAQAQPQQGSQPGSQQAVPSQAMVVEDLRGRIHGMRMNLLLGGPQVKSAEAEAIDFYNQKINFVEERIDSVQIDASEKRAAYDVALERAVSAGDKATRESSLQKAQDLRAEIAALDRESRDLIDTRGNLSNLIGAVQARGEERTKLASRLETSISFDEGFGLSLGGVGLAPEVEVQPTGSPFEDEQLLSDLMERDPRGARKVLYELDPERYWQRFPLRPPSQVIRSALSFPLADLPGDR